MFFLISIVHSIKVDTKVVAACKSSTNMEL